MIERFEKFSFNIAEIDHYWHKITTVEMEKYHLKGSYAIYFTMLYQYQEGLTAAQLSEECSRDKADVSRAVNILEKEGFLRKECANQNQYRARLILTEKGRKTAEDINDRAARAVELGGKGLTDQERRIFYYALDLIASNLERLSKEGIPQK